MDSSLYPKISLASVHHKLLLLVGIYVFCIIVSETMWGKTIPIWSNISLDLWFVVIKQLKVSVAIFLLPLIFGINDIIIEVFGSKTAKTVYRIWLLSIVALVIFASLAVRLPPSMIFQSSQEAYTLIFGQTIRIALASITAFAISDLLDIVIFARIRAQISHLWLRSNISNIFAQLVDTTLFVYLAFFSGDHGFVRGIILPYWIFKCLMSVITTPIIYRWVKRLRF